MSIKAVIFDLDGLMIDSERFNYDCMGELLAQYGEQPQEDWFETMIGMDNYECAEFIIQQAGLPLTPEDYIDALSEITLDALPKICTPNPGLMDLIDQLERLNLKLAVGSNSFENYVKTALTALGILDRFDCVLTASDVEKGKPDPEIFLRTAECLGVAPQDCLVLEDSPLGMQGALRAGMDCAVIPNPSVDRSNFTGATHMFSSLEELNGALDEVLPGREG